MLQQLVLFSFGPFEGLQSEHREHAVLRSGGPKEYKNKFLITPR